ncbi:MAG: hypothetical protein ACRDI3_05780 [Actinomycetota bacterium]
MKIKRLFIVGLMVLGAFGVMSGTAHAECLSDKVPGTLDDRYLGDTCSGCGWIMIHGKYIPLFPC